MTKNILKLAFVCLLTLAGCKAEEAAVDCVTDSECSAGFFCDTANNLCRCRTDDACGVGQYCNSFGVCQARPPCLGNKDCEAGEICNSADLTGGACIAAENCGTSIHCPFNQYCNAQSLSCTPGCQTSGDCQLGYVCIAGQCTSGGTSANCTTCPASPAPDATYCEYGETCSLSGACSAHSLKNSLCSSCDPGNIFNPQYCPGGMICLLDDIGGGNYCAPTCDNDLDCPNGYNGCGGVQVVSQTGCSSDAECGAGKRCIGSAEGDLTFCTCAADADCTGGISMCSLGLCLTDFVTSCTSDADCLCSGGQCVNLTGFSCNSGADCMVSCQQVEYGDGSTIGVCETNAKVCGKDEGFSCSDLSGTAPCQQVNQ